MKEERHKMRRKMKIFQTRKQQEKKRRIDQPRTT